jgi:hypothetical protein
LIPNNNMSLGGNNNMPLGGGGGEKIHLGENMILDDIVPFGDKSEAFFQRGCDVHQAAQAAKSRWVSAGGLTEEDIDARALVVDADEALKASFKEMKKKERIMKINNGVFLSSLNRMFSESMKPGSELASKIDPLSDANSECKKKVVYSMDISKGNLPLFRNLVMIFDQDKNVTLEKNMSMGALQRMFQDILMYFSRELNESQKSLEKTCSSPAIGEKNFAKYARKIRGIVLAMLKRINEVKGNPGIFSIFDRGYDNGKYEFSYATPDIEAFKRKYLADWGVAIEDADTFAVNLKWAHETIPELSLDIRINVCCGLYEPKPTPEGQLLQGPRSYATEEYRITRRVAVDRPLTTESSDCAVYIPHQAIGGRKINMDNVFLRIKEILATEDVTTFKCFDFDMEEYCGDTLGVMKVFVTAFFEKAHIGGGKSIESILYSLQTVRSSEESYFERKNQSNFYKKLKENGWDFPHKNGWKKWESGVVGGEDALKPAGVNEPVRPISTIKKFVDHEPEGGGKSGVVGGEDALKPAGVNEPVRPIGYFKKVVERVISNNKQAREGAAGGAQKNSNARKRKNEQGGLNNNKKHADSKDEAMHGAASIQDYIAKLRCKFTARSRVNVAVSKSIHSPDLGASVQELEKMAKESLDVKNMTPTCLSVRESRAAAQAASGSLTNEHVGALLSMSVGAASRIFPICAA